METNKESKSFTAEALKTMEPLKCGFTRDLRFEEYVPTMVYWQGEQWEITNYGLQAPSRRYFIEASRMWEDEGSHFGWKQHMANKLWIDMADFEEALDIARARWPKLAELKPIVDN